MVNLNLLNKFVKPKYMIKMGIFGIDKISVGSATDFGEAVDKVYTLYNMSKVSEDANFEIISNDYNSRTNYVADEKGLRLIEANGEEMYVFH